MLFNSKKAIIGIGMLIIFIASILVSALAAGVVLRATGILQQKALKTEEIARNRLVTMVEVVALEAISIIENETVEGFEIMTRLSAGSNNIDFTNLAFNVFTANETFTASYNQSRSVNAPGNCTMANLVPEEEFCIDVKFGNQNIVLEEDELVVFRWAFNRSHYMSTNTDFSIAFIPQEGSYVNMELQTPKVLNRRLTHIRI